MAKLIFVNLPVADLACATAFYEAIGAVKNPQFCDHTASCMAFSDTIYAMLMTHDKYRQFTSKKIADAKTTSQVLLCLSADSRGEVDAIVGKAEAAGGVAELSEDAWDTQMEYNLKTAFLGCRHAIPVMIAQGGGAIVNIASASGTRWSGSAQVGYATSKAGVIQFSRVTAVQYANKGIRVNTVVPGQLHTPMVEARLAKQRTGGDIDALLKSRVERIPLGFMGDGRDTANAALFLASDEARFVTGTEIIVDGGMVARCD